MLRIILIMVCLSCLLGCSNQPCDEISDDVKSKITVTIITNTDDMCVFAVTVETGEIS
jgi:hypothetical protein